MLRWVVALLLAVNLGFYAWSHGWLGGPAGPRGQAEREPERLVRQVRPERVQLLPDGRAAQAAQADVVAGLEAGPFANEQLPAAGSAPRRAGLAEERWQRETPH